MGLQEGLSRSTAAITGNGNLVKQIVFPSEILPLKVALGTLPTLMIGLFATICISAIAGRLDPLGLLVLLPVALTCYILLLAGLSYLLAAVGVFVRDVKDLIAFLLTIGLFLHPVLYTPASTPAWLAPIFVVSPFSHMIWCFRDALIGRDPSHVWSWVVFPIVSILAFVLGWRTFRMLKPTFGNAL
jgi:lipopolysaccharide transport system permease protein